MKHPVICLFVPVLLAACGDAEPERPAPLVLTAAVMPAGPAGAPFSGEIQARSNAPLAFRVGGLITARLVKRGDLVKRGQRLMLLDTADVGLASEEAEAQAQAAAQAVTAAGAAAQRAAADLARLVPLVGAGGISASALDAARAAADTSAAELTAAQQRARAAAAGAGRARNQRAYAALVADADGVVADVLADAGQIVSAGQPVLGLARSGARDAVVALPEAMAGARAQRARAQLVGDPRSFDAVLREVSGTVDPVTRTVEARFSLAGADAVQPGRTVRIALTGGTAGDKRAGIVSVPLAAIIDRGKGSGVWIIGPDRQVRLRAVKVVAVADDKARVTSTIKAGDTIVALGAHLLSEGQLVRVDSLPQ